MENELVFNPLAKENLGKSVVEALMEKPARPLAEVGIFSGAGVYAIYYCGPFPPYRPLSSLNKDGARHPIYAGKAIPDGGRKGSVRDSSLQSKALSKRLREHKMSIEEVPSLDLNHFSFRSLVVDDIWIPLGETLLIQKYKPLWNQVVDGFGNHAPGKGRGGGRKPLWDELHPGRKWASALQPPKWTQGQIIAAITEHLETIRP
jgi:hypothetical protein